MGLGLLHGAVWPDEPYSAWFKAVMAVPGVLVLGAGVVGLAMALRRVVVERSSRGRLS